MPSYIHKPTQVEAFRFGYDSAPEWFKSALKAGAIIPASSPDTQHALIVTECSKNTLGWHVLFNIGDYIVRKQDDRLYIYPEEQFLRLYKLVSV